MRESRIWGALSCTVLALAVGLLAGSALAQKGGRGGGGSSLPANANVAFASTKGLQLIDTVTGEIGTLANEGHGPAWSPDGTQIAYMREGNLGIVIRNSDGSGSGRLVTTVSNLTIMGRIDWSRAATPNGRHMLLFTDSDSQFGPGTVYAIGTDGTGKVALAGNATMIHGPRWSPSGNQFIYTQSGSATVVCTVGMVNGELAVVGPPVSLPLGSSDCDWSNDGRWIVVVGAGVEGHGDLWLIDSTNFANRQRLTSTPEAELWPSFNATDTRIFFTDGNSFPRLYSIDAMLGGTPVLESGKAKNIYRPQCRRDAGTGSSNFAGPICSGSNGQLQHAVTPPPSIGKKSTVRATGGPSDGNGFWALGAEQLPWRFPGTQACYLRVAPVLTFGIDYDATGLFELRVRVPHDPRLIGAKLCSQFAGFDPGAPGGITLSNAVSIVLGG